MKQLTRERVVPIISAKVSCVMRGINSVDSPGSPYSAIRRPIIARRFFAGIEELINKICL
jgi:hypothetical protein